MTKLFLILLAMLFITNSIFFFLWKFAKEKQEETQWKLEEANKYIAKAIREQAKLESTIQILSKNRKEADEKINNLHDGDSISNALNELRKRES